MLIKTNEKRKKINTCKTDFTWKTLEWEKTTVPLKGERNHYESLMVYTLRSLTQLPDNSLYNLEPLFMGFRVLFILVYRTYAVLVGEFLFSVA